MKNNIETIISNISIIMVLYNRKPDESEAFISLHESAKNLNTIFHIILVDNSPLPLFTKSELREFKHFTIEYLHNSDNPGVSKAYNQGVRIAKENKKQWVLLSDQDTTFPIDALTQYINAIIEDSTEKVFVPLLHFTQGIFSPVKYSMGRGWMLSTIRRGKHSFKKYSVVNSGILIFIETFVNAGGYKESVKLDFSDFVFIERVKKVHTTFTLLNLDCTQEASFDVNTTLESALIRFQYYCEGARNMEYSHFSDRLCKFFVLLRGIKLAIHYNSSQFIRHLLQSK
jgi:GT2 family glycosyltransferase